MMVLTFILVMKFPILAYFLNYIVFNRSKKGGGIHQKGGREDSSKGGGEDSSKGGGGGFIKSLTFTPFSK